MSAESIAGMQAMQWVADNVQYPAVVSASIAGANSAALNQAAESLVNDFGITVVAAAGESVQSSAHLCYFGPISKMCTVQESNSMEPRCNLCSQNTSHIVGD